MKKIVYTVTSLSNSGGIERCLVNKANWLVDNDYDVTIITEDSINCFYQVDPRVKILSLNIKKGVSNYSIIRFCLFIVFSISYGFKISRLLRKINPDIVMSANARDFVILPFVNRSSKKIYEFHWIVSRRLKEDNFLRRMISRIMNIIGNRYDNIILLTQKDKDGCSNEWRNIKVIPNALTFTCNTPAQLINHQVIAVGNLFHIKGFSRLIDIWNLVHQRCPEWSLYIYGDGYLREELQAKINKLQLGNIVKLRGKVKDIEAAYLKSSISLISSYEESFSLTLLEAQTCGLPVVAFDCPFGPSEIITDGVDGFLIPNDNLEDFANKICLLIENEKLRKDMGNRAYHNSKRFAEEKVMPMWVHLFNE